MYLALSGGDGAACRVFPILVKMYDGESVVRVFGYIFLARDKHLLVAEAEQLASFREYAATLGRPVEATFVEEGVSLRQPFKDRPEGARLLRRCGAGDIILAARIEWVLSSVGDGENLLRILRESRIALHCLDLGGNISTPEKRRLMVSEGPALIVEKLLSALKANETSRHGQAIRRAKKRSKDEGKYLGGPVPFGWEVNSEGYLVADDGQQQVIRTIIGMRRDRRSYRQISRKLKEELRISLSHEGVRRIVEGDKNRQGTGRALSSGQKKGTPAHAPPAEDSGKTP